MNGENDVSRIGRFKAEAVQVFSGDDLTLMISLGFDDLYKRKRVRLYKVDTPNAVNQSNDTEAGRLRSLVHNLVWGKTLYVTPVRQLQNNLVAIIEIEEGGSVTNLNDKLIAMGFEFKGSK